MRKVYLGIFTLILFLSSCSRGEKEEESQSSTPGTRIVEEFYPDGKLKSRTEAIGKLRQGVSKEYRKDGKLENLINYENNRKHGPASTYYPDGKTVKIKMNYENGFKNGESKWYYQNGNIYRETFYVNGKIQGIRNTYYDDGTLQSEIPYQDSKRGMGLQEYNAYGNPKAFNAKIVFNEKDRISLDSKFILTLSLSDGTSKVEFFEGKLSNGKYWNDQLSPIPANDGTGEMVFHVSKGTFKMETINIVARVKTSLNNYHILQREYHLALENKF